MADERRRYIYIDLLRGWAVIVMIETHVVNAFMLPALRDTWWFAVLNFINGIVAPAFLFVAGYAFVLVGQRKWSGYLRFGGVFWKQAGRILQILLVGYALHIPFYSLQRLVAAPPEAWYALWRVDVLHAIAASLLLLLALVIIGRTPGRFFALIAVVGSAVVFSTPLLWNANVDGLLPLPVANYVNALHGSLFPLFPWLGFVFFGGITAQLLVWSQGKGERQFFQALLVAGFALILVSLLLELSPIRLYPEHDFWRASPAFFFIRLGVVLVLLVVLWWWERRFRSGASPASIIGSESLVTYAGHLLVIYGLFFRDKSLSFIIGKTRDVPEVAVMMLALMALMYLVGLLWHRLKKRSMLQARVVQYTLLAVAIVIFVTR